MGEKENLMKHILSFLSILAALSLAACGNRPGTIAAEPTAAPPVSAAQTEAPQAQPPAGTGSSTYTVTNPASGASLYVGVFFPDSWDGQSNLPALVLVPGGSGDSGGFLKQTPAGSTVDAVNQAGYVAIVFDPDGRGQSGGTEDYNGFIHQDGLAEVIRFASTLPGVDSANIGLVTTSYGITMGAGVLARYPDLPIKFLIDWEGPADRNDTGGCDESNLGHLAEVAACDDEAFWAEREASTFISQIKVPYQRIQSEKDHVQPDYDHTVLMINNAVNGGVSWVRLNNETPNQTLDPNALPRMLPENMDRRKDQLIVDYATELFNP
jgi:dipeptidyl aminopeptidase/acylaminoacyl peptidase